MKNKNSLTTHNRRVRRPKHIATRFAGVFLLALMTTLASFPVQAATPAPIEQPPACVTTTGGQTEGYCPDNSPGYSVAVGGGLSAGGTVTLQGSPNVPACNTFSDAGQTWSPSPCYGQVTLAISATCYYVDLSDGKFKSNRCAAVLYKDGVDISTFPYNRYGDYFDGLFTYEGASQPYSSYVAGCSNTGNFGSFVDGYMWAARAGSALRCTATFNGSRPDGLYGPTWMEVIFGAPQQFTGNGFRARHPTLKPGIARTLIPVSGDLRDLGVVADFDAKVVGRKAAFTSHSMATGGGALTYQWDFGDNKSATEPNPTHIYDAGGTYTVSLTARDTDGIESTKTKQIEAIAALIVELVAPEPIPKVGEQADIQVDLHNYETSDLGGLTLDFDVDGTHLDVVSGPTPNLPSTLAKDLSTSVVYTVEAKHSGIAEVTAAAEGTLSEGRPVHAEASATLRIPAQIALELSSSAKSETRAGDEVQIFLKLTNNEEVTVDGIKVEPLGILPNELLSTVSGPKAPDGSDPRVNPISLDAGESVIVTFTYRAEQKGVARISAFVAGNDPYGSGRFTTGAKGTVAIESAAIEFSNLRLQPGHAIPGTFAFLRGTVTNVGSIDVTDTDVGLLDVDQFEILPESLARLGADISPRIAKLATDESHDFIVPLGVRQLFGPQNSERPPYTLGLRMQGTAVVDGEDVDVVVTETVGGTLDLTQYWFSILDDVRANLVGGFQKLLVAFSDIVDAVGNTSLGGTPVGKAEGILNALQSMGDGLLTVGDIGVNTVNGEYHLNEKGKALVQAVIEYGTTRSGKQVLVDFADLQENGALALGDASNATLDVVGHWMQDVAQARAKGNDREVARLLTKPAATVALGALGEAAVSEAVAPVLAKIIAKVPAPVRKALSGLKKAPEEEGLLNLLDPDQVAPPLTAAEQKALAAKYYNDVGLDIEDIPTGVPLSRETVARAGIAEDEYTELVDLARRKNTTIYARPRPSEAAEYAKLGYNAKPMPIKIKSITEIDAEWLGYPDKPALVPLKEPVDPYPALKEALESGRFDGTEPEIYQVIERYNLRQAEWQEHVRFLDEANSVKIVKDANGNVIDTYKGIKIKRFGREFTTELYVDGDGLLRYTLNNEPIYSDIDIYYIGEPGGPISLDKYNEVTRELDITADQQHRTTANSADFPNQDIANKFIERYGNEHKRGGEPLIIIGPDVTTFGYVDTLEFNPATVEGSGEALYNKLVTVTFEGDSTGAIAP